MIDPWPPTGIDWYYHDEWTAIACGDCREILPQLPKVDLVLTDPPFSEYTHANAKSNRDKGHGNKAIDFKAIDFKAICEIYGAIRCDGWLVAFMDWRHIADISRQCPAPWEFVRFGVWVKTNPMPQISSDRPANGWGGICYLYPAGAPKKWNGGGHHGNWVGPLVTDGKHPTAKPLELISTLVGRHSDIGQSILDPFMGSGTTLVAAKQLGRKAIGIEIEEKYCEIAVERLSQETIFSELNQ